MDRRVRVSFSFGFDIIVPELSPDCPRASLTKNFKFRFASPKRRQTHAFGCKTLAIRNFAFRFRLVSSVCILFSNCSLIVPEHVRIPCVLEHHEGMINEYEHHQAFAHL